jgi:hypothetical protein
VLKPKRIKQTHEKIPATASHFQLPEEWLHIYAGIFLRKAA